MQSSLSTAWRRLRRRLSKACGATSRILLRPAAAMNGLIRENARSSAQAHQPGAVAFSIRTKVHQGPARRDARLQAGSNFVGRIRHIAIDADERLVMFIRLPRSPLRSESACYGVKDFLADVGSGPLLTLEFSVRCYAARFALKRFLRFRRHLGSRYPAWRSHPPRSRLSQGYPRSIPQMGTEILLDSEKSLVSQAMNGQAPQLGRLERISDRQQACALNRKTLYCS